MVPSFCSLPAASFLGPLFVQPTKDPLHVNKIIIITFLLQGLQAKCYYSIWCEGAYLSFISSEVSIVCLYNRNILKGNRVYSV